MKLPLYISRRYTRSKKDSKFISLISTIAIIGISLGVAILIIALSILKGFEETLTNKLIAFDAHIQISSYKGILPDYKLEMDNLKNLLTDNLEDINPFAAKLAIISSKAQKEGVTIKGILPDNNSLQIKDNLVEGEYLLNGNDIPSIIIGRKLANKLLVSVGDAVTVFALPKDEAPSQDNYPNIQKFVVTGIFESGMAEYDDLNSYVTIEAAQRLFNLGSNIMGYDIKLKDMAKADSLTEHLNSSLKYPYAARSIFQIHRNIFTWIELQKKPIPLVLALIILVAVFNVVATIFMIVIEKTNAVGIFKSLGASSTQIIGIFILQGIYLGLTGIVIGNIFAFVIMEAQLQLNLISLPSSVYFMSSVPILLEAETFFGVSLVTLILCALASLLPSYIASKIQPISALRFN